MDTITILRELWHRRLLVAGVVVLSALAGFAISLSSHPQHVARASAHLLVDTPSSQVIDVAPKGGDQLGGQALLLAGLMVDGPIKATIAHDAGLNPNQITGTSESITGAGSSAPGAAARPYRMSTQVLTDSSGQQLPIIEIDVQAPSASAATRLAQAALTGVQSYENSVASSEKITSQHRLRLNSLGVTQATVTTSGSAMLVSLLVAIGVLLVGCGLVVAGSALRRRLRAAAAAERFSSGGLLAADGELRSRSGFVDLARSAEDDPEADEDGGSGQRSHELIVVRGDSPEGLAANRGH